MKITIHRGSDQIGGCITEYEINGRKLFVDYGDQLQGSPISEKPLQIEGLNTGDVSKSTLLITHYHKDHVGKIYELPDELPIYMGRISKDILSELSNHLSSVSNDDARLAKRLETVKTFNAGELLEIGDFKIMPVRIDHSAFDAYAFKIEAEGIKVFHTGDFRTHGFRGKSLPKVIDKYVGQVDYVVCEGTNISRSNATCKTERDLQKEYEQSFKENKFNIVYLSSGNIDRLFSLYHASLKAGRPFYVDPFQKKIMDIVTQRDNTWGKSRLYQYCKPAPEPLKYKEGKNEFLFTSKFENLLNNIGYVLIARANKKYDDLISQMPGEDKKIYLSMWDGYVNPKLKAYNPNLAKFVGKDYLYWHTSGHCDMGSIHNLFEMLRPKAIIPIHTAKPQEFAEEFSDKWPILLLKDGESFSPIKDPGYDDITSSIFAVKVLSNLHHVISSVDNAKCYSLDEKYLGEFQNKADAISPLKKVKYAPKRLLGYSYDDTEDMDPWITQTFNSDLSLNSEYVYGAHSHEGNEFQIPSKYKAGDKVLCVIYNGLDIVFPATVEDSTTLDYLKEFYEKDELTNAYFDSFEDYINNGLGDCVWDSVVVKPLVQIDNAEWEERMLISRTLVFPFKEFDI